MTAALRFAWRTLATIVVLVSVAVLFLADEIPRLAGPTPYTVRSGSMEPTLPKGSLIVVRHVDPHDIRIGTVVTFQVRSGDPEVATHRVVGAGTTVRGAHVYRTKGDANNAVDPAPVTDAQIRGRTWYVVPYLGYLSALLARGQRQVFA